MKRYLIIVVLFAIPLLLMHSCVIDTEKFDAVKDIDGNIYGTKKIGTQTWMTSNLKTTRYTDGTTIPMVEDQVAWDIPKEPAMCWYDNSTDNMLIYGGLYNFYVFDTAYNGGKKLCPAGWHVPSIEDWDILIEYLGGYYSAGDLLKDVEHDYWINAYYGNNNAARFSAFPAGYRTGEGDFDNMGSWAVWWSSTEKSATAASGIMIAELTSAVSLNEKVSKNIGTSIRCIKD